jgi:hypothetical protein
MSSVAASDGLLTVSPSIAAPDSISARSASAAFLKSLADEQRRFRSFSIAQPTSVSNLGWIFGTSVETGSASSVSSFSSSFQGVSE